MLILTRKPGETICIGDDTTVVVLSIDQKRVKLGIEAPKHVAIDREEIAEKRRHGIPPPVSDKQG